MDNFKKIITENYYYVDKTMFIKELLDLKGEENLFLRPRRFGKTLNLSMLKYFFEDTGSKERNADNRKLFRNLGIMDAGDLYTNEMGQYQVIHLTLKSAKQRSFESAYAKMKEEIAEEFNRHKAILDNSVMTETVREKFCKIADG